MLCSACVCACWAQNRKINLRDLKARDLFFSDLHIKQWFKRYMRKVIHRTNTLTGVVYRDDPTIFAWELMNEPRACSDPSGQVLQVYDTLNPKP